MNQCYKIVYSKIRQCFVVVSELTKSHGKGSRSSRLRKAVVTLFAATALGGLSGQALGAPDGDGATLQGDDASAVGIESSAWGVNTQAKGKASTAFGNGTSAISDNATAWGEGTTAGKLLYNGVEATIEKYQDGLVTKYKIVPV